MDIAFDRKSGAQATRSAGISGRNPGASAGSLDWPGLRARLSAARCAYLALNGNRLSGTAASAGSFDCVSARALADFGISQRPVNPIFWADRKPGRAKDTVTAGETSTGARGLK